jgi:hypothetical protein
MLRVARNFHRAAFLIHSNQNPARVRAIVRTDGVHDVKGRGGFGGRHDAIVSRRSNWQSLRLSSIAKAWRQSFAEDKVCNCPSKALAKLQIRHRSRQFGTKFYIKPASHPSAGFVKLPTLRL